MVIVFNYKGIWIEKPIRDTQPPPPPPKPTK